MYYDLHGQLKFILSLCVREIPIDIPIYLQKKKLEIYVVILVLILIDSNDNAHKKTTLYKRQRFTNNITNSAVDYNEVIYHVRDNNNDGNDKVPRKRNENCEFFTDSEMQNLFFLKKKLNV